MDKNKDLNFKLNIKPILEPDFKGYKEPKCMKDAEQAWTEFSALLGLICAKGNDMDIATLKEYTKKLQKIADIKETNNKKKGK